MNADNAQGEQVNEVYKAQEIQQEVVEESKDSAEAVHFNQEQLE